METITPVKFANVPKKNGVLLRFETIAFKVFFMRFKTLYPLPGVLLSKNGVLKISTIARDSKTVLFRFVTSVFFIFRVKNSLL